MNGLTAIAYVSTLLEARSENKIEALLADARTFNAEVGVTGVLILHDSSVFQYFEGPAEDVSDVYQRIRASTSHKNIVELLNQSIEHREFATWLMGFALAPKSTLLQLEQARWRTEIANKSFKYSPSLGLGLLLDFCSNFRGGLSRQ